MHIRTTCALCTIYKYIDVELVDMAERQSSDQLENETEQMTTSEMIEKLEDVVGEASDAYDDGDLETARLKLAEVNNNIGNVLMQVNIEESRTEVPADD